MSVYGACVKEILLFAAFGSVLLLWVGLCIYGSILVHDMTEAVNVRSKEEIVPYVYYWGKMRRLSLAYRSLYPHGKLAKRLKVLQAVLFFIFIAFASALFIWPR
jgi:hypothetical protein